MRQCRGLSKPQLRRAVEYIHSNLEKNPSLAEVAQEIRISPFYFTRLFKQSTGLPPHRYLIRCRIESAKKLLSEADLTIAEIAAKLGFQDQSHFTSQFRRETGTTPKAYRQTR